MNPTYPSEEFNTNGHGSIDVLYEAWATSAHLVEPGTSPESHPDLGHNEYVMMGADAERNIPAAPFAVPTRTFLPGSVNHMQLSDSLRSQSSWELSRGLPNALPPIEHGMTGYTGDYLLPHQLGATLFAQFRSDLDDALPSDPPLKGLGFSTKNGLPASNNDFGKRDLKYFLRGSLIDTAPIEIFYASTRTSHAPGGPPGYLADVPDHRNPGQLLPGATKHERQVPTPNWFYYYNQAYPCSGAQIEYVRDDSHPALGAVSTLRTGHIHMVNAHGNSYTLRFERRYDWSDGRLKLAYMWAEKVRGIDTYARTMAHELKHIETHNNYSAMIETAEQNGVDDEARNADGTMQDPWGDPDNDGLPSQIEEGLGLNPRLADSTGAVGQGVLSGESYTSDRESELTKADNEVVARMAEAGVYGPKALD